MAQENPYLSAAVAHNQQRQAKRSSSFKVPKASGTPVAFTSGTKKSQTPLGWVMDMLTRPESAVTNVIQSGINYGVDAKKAFDQGHVGEGIGDALRAGNIPGNALSGLFSADPKQHRSFSQVLEESTDKIGSLDPNYKNVQDNVNPVLKGVVGFAGDVALDPLTYIPGAQLLKGARLGVDAAKGATQAVKSSSALRDIMDAALKRTGKEATKVPELDKAAPATRIDRAEADAADSAQAVDADLVPAGPRPSEMFGTPAEQQVVDAPEVPKVNGVGPADAKPTASAHTDEIREALEAQPDLKELLKGGTEGLTAEATDQVRKLVAEAVSKGASSTRGKNVRSALDKLTFTPHTIEDGVEALKDVPGAQELELLGDDAVTAQHFADDADSALGQHYAKQVDAEIADAKPAAPEFAGEVTRDEAKRGFEGRPVDHPDTWIGQLADALDAADDPDSVMKNGAQIRKAITAFTTTRNPQAINFLKKVRGAWEKSYNSAQNAGLRGIDATGKPLERAVVPEEVGAVRDVTPSEHFEKVQQELQRSTSEVVQHLGPKLAKTLGRFNRPETLQSQVLRMKAILDSEMDLTALKKLGSGDRELLRRIGVDTDTFPTGLSRFQAEPNVGPVAKTPIEQAASAAEGLPAADGSVVADAQAAMKASWARDYAKENVDGKYVGTTTQGGVRRTHNARGEGEGLRHNEHNSYNQYTLANHLVNRGAATLKDAGLYGAQRAEAMREWFMPRQRLVERAFEQMGVPSTVGIGKGRVPLAYSQILDTLDHVDPKVSRWAVFNPSTAVAHTNLLDAVWRTLHGADKDELVTTLLNTQRRNGGTMANSMATEGKFGRTMLQPEAMASQLADTLLSAKPTLEHVVSDNAERLGARQLAETYNLSNQVMQGMEDLFSTPGSTGQLLASLADSNGLVDEAAKAAGALRPAREMAKGVVEAELPARDVAVAKGAVDVTRLIERTAAESDVTKRAQKAYTDTLEADPNLPAFDSSGGVEDLGEKIDRAMGLGILGKTHAVLSRSVGAKDLHPKLVSSETIYRTGLHEFNARLSNIARAGTPREELANKLLNARHGVGLDDPETAELGALWGRMFGMGEREGVLLDNAFFRNGNKLEHVNQVLSESKLPESLRISVDDAKRVAKAEGISAAEASLRQIRDWEIEDPLDAMQKMYKGFFGAQVDQTMAQEFERMAEGYNASSRTPKPGWKRPVDSTGKSTYMRYLDPEKYYHPDVISQMHVVDQFRHEFMDLGGPLGKFVREVFQPSQQVWKTGMTIYNPSHHVRNLVGDMSLTYLSLGAKGAVRAQRSAMQALATRNAYDGYDAIKALQALGRDADRLPNAGHTVASGKLGELTADGLYTAMANRGNLLSFKYLEELNPAVAEGGGRIQKATDAIQHNRVTQKIGGVSEARDHYVRLAHAAQFISQNINSSSYKTMDELLDAASASARKWHPDGTDMTRAEQYFRLLVPFYSWQRKAIPLIAESVLTHPGRVTAFPKAQFNLATAMGVNPDSLSDPFPDDQMFPSYLSDKITGPVAELGGKYYGINPGISSNDVLNDWVGGNPVRQALGSISPIIRAPFELAAGGQVATGARINDDSDYVDSQIPGLSQISRLTGYSPTGSALGFITGTGPQQQYQIQKGNKDAVSGPALSALNWLTGAGISPMSQPNQIKQAEFEARDKASQQKGR